MGSKKYLHLWEITEERMFAASHTCRHLGKKVIDNGWKGIRLLDGGLYLVGSGRLEIDLGSEKS